MNSKAKRPTYLLRVGMAHKRLILSVVLGLIVAVAAPLPPITRMLIGWDVGVLAYLIAAAVVMTQCSSARQMQSQCGGAGRGRIRHPDPQRRGGDRKPRRHLRRARDHRAHDPSYGLYVALAIGTVVLSWAFTHTIFALHYAHEFYGEHLRKSGLKFPGDGQPDYWDFVYFAFVIGMTFQVSDVAVTHKSIRRMVVAHGALSFFFTAAIISVTVNIAASVIQK